MKIKAIVTGASGMVGEGVLIECLKHPDVEEVLVIGRRHCGIKHPKLKEILHSDFFNLIPIAEQLKGYNACYFCLGVSSVGKKEPEYTQLTYVLTMHMANLLSSQNPDMTFCYVSGAGTNPTGNMMWARVKGKTENDLMALPFRQVFAFRPAFMKATAGQQNLLKAYRYFSWLYPIFILITPNATSTLSQVGLAMIRVTLDGYKSKVIEVKDIKMIAPLG